MYSYHYVLKQIFDDVTNVQLDDQPIDERTKSFESAGKLINEIKYI